MQQFVLASCVLSLNGLLAAVDLAAGPVRPGPELRSIPSPVTQASAPNARPAAPRRGATRNGANTADTTRPVVSSFSLPASLTLTKFGQYMPVTVKASDDLSGLGSINALIVSPSGNQQMGIDIDQSIGETRTDRRVGHWAYPNMEPGIWQLQRVGACDLVMNCQDWDGGTQLQAIKGRHQVEVKNAFYDATPPTLSKGVLSLTRVAGLRALAAADIVALDVGDPRASGATYATALMCNLSSSHCFGLQGSNPLPDQSEAKLRMVGWVEDDLPVGTYHIKELILADFFGNVRTYTSTTFSGETDFSGLFNVTSLSL